MDSRRAKLIAEVIKHLESMDGEALKGEMNPPMEMAVSEGGMGKDEKNPMEMLEGTEKSEKGPMEMLADKGDDPKSEMADDEMSDEELEELANMGKMGG
jgi:hypothetical protein